MGFQIKDKDGNALTMKQLDAEAAAFWKKEVHPKNYADPSEPRAENESEVSYLRRSMTSNWFDIIGYCIHSQGHEASGWANVVATMMATQLGMCFIDTSDGYKDRPVKVTKFIKDEIKETVIHLPDEVEKEIFGILYFYRPFIELINHWKEKGYTPHKVED